MSETAQTTEHTFEVLNAVGVPVMRTLWHDCVPDKDELKSLHTAGYTFRVDGKSVTLRKVIEIYGH